MDRATAQALIDAEVSAVVNAEPMISGRYPNLGPQLLVEAGITLVDGVGAAALAAIGEGRTVRLHEGEVYAGEDLLARGRELDVDTVAAELDGARAGLATQLETFTHNSTEFLRREQDLLLHGRGVPRLDTRIAGRPVVVVARGHEHEQELARITAFVREQHPVLVGVGGGAEVLRAAGFKPDVVVLDARADDPELPSAKVLRSARDVVVRVDRGDRSQTDALERLGVRPKRFESAATPEDAGLILADAGEAAVIVAVGLHATLDELLDRQRSGLASTYLTRLKVGPRLVDASALPFLYSGRVRPWHVLLVLLAGLVALAAAISVTPVGQDWLDSLTDALRTTWQGLST